LKDEGKTLNQKNKIGFKKIWFLKGMIFIILRWSIIWLFMLLCSLLLACVSFVIAINFLYFCIFYFLVFG